MKLCKTCVYGTEYELDKPCIVYRADCRYYRKRCEGMELKIGQAVLVHGYIDEIRTDTVIIRNDGGYFGTVPSEIEEIVQEPGAGEMLICPDCGLEVHSDFKTCPRCGAKMIEPQESEDKE